ncbi:kinase-like domain-containing protein, partial [Mycena leptocephala]
MSSPSAGASSPLPNLTGTFVDEGYLELVQLLASDATSQVYKAFDTNSLPEDPVYYAVKCMWNGATGSQRVTDLQHEFGMHRAVSHLPGVVRFHYTFTDGEHHEFHGLYVDCPGRIRDAFLQLIDAVAECHHQGVYHRDLRPSHVSCNSRGTGIQQESTQFQVGSGRYMSPGSMCRLTRDSYSPRDSDLWALAMILFTLITGTTPWAVPDSSDAGYAAYRADEDNHLVEAFHLTPAANDFFRRCFTADPADGPT